MAKFEAAFKRPKSGKLWWLVCDAKDNAEATTKLKDYADSPQSGYLLYGGPFEKKDEKESNLLEPSTV